MDPVEIMQWAGAVVVCALAVVAICLMVIVVRAMFRGSEGEPKSGTHQIDLSRDKDGPSW